MVEGRSVGEAQSLWGRSRNDSWSSEESDTLAAQIEMDDLEDASISASRNSTRSQWWRRSRTGSKSSKLPALQQGFAWTRRKRSRYHRISRLALNLPYMLIVLLVVTATFFPSYTAQPRRYGELRQSVLQARRDGAANPSNEKVFIAASLYDADGDLLRGDWGRSVLHLVDMLGHDNVFVSIYENDPSEAATLAMFDFRRRLPCRSSVVQEKLDTSNMDHVTAGDGTQRLKRISFLAGVRNQALQPLEDEKSEAYSITWDKLLFLNDIVFDPIDAANLLLNTNINLRTRRTDYRAACAVDFINPFKFYDTFATRDLEGYDMGVPFYPWFTNAGAGQSRADVLSQTDAVRVKSCWGGMVAFEAKWFQGARPLAQAFESSGPSHRLQSTKIPEDTTQSSQKSEWTFKPDDQVIPSSTRNNHLTRSPTNINRNVTSPRLRFRSESETFWDASECCLIHADLAQAVATTTTTSTQSGDTGIYLNPYIRIAYTRSTLRWLGFTRRFERLYTPFHALVNWIASRPSANTRRFEGPGEKVVHRVWRWDEPQDNRTVPSTGSYVRETIVATPGMFCGSRKLLYIRNETEERGDGKNWASERAPKVPV